jgi:hypothetical protein
MVETMPEYTDTFKLPNGAGGMAAGMKHNRIKDRIMEFSHDTGIDVTYELKGYDMILKFANADDYAIYKLNKAEYFSPDKIRNIPGRRFK